MRKLFTVLAVAAVVTLCSCGGKKGDSEIDAKIDKYEQVCDRAAELGARMKAGDLTVAEELSDVATEMAQQAQDLAPYATEMTQEQADRIQAASEKVEAAL